MCTDIHQMFLEISKHYYTCIAKGTIIAAIRIRRIFAAFFIYVLLNSLAIFMMCSKILMDKTRNHCAGKYPILLHLF